MSAIWSYSASTTGDTLSHPDTGSPGKWLGVLNHALRAVRRASPASAVRLLERAFGAPRFGLLAAYALYVAKRPAWIVRRGDADVFLFGVRPGGRAADWLDDDIESAMESADEFWRETPPEAEITSSPLLAEHGLSGDTPLSARLKPALLDRLQTVASSLGVDVAGLEALRPWVVAQVVQQATLERAGIAADQNMDIVLSGLAERHGVAIRYEFDVESILRTFGQMTRGSEHEYLGLVLDAAEAGAALIDAGYAEWLRGDRTLDELGDLILRQKYPRFYEHLIRRRNAAWLPRIDDMLQRPGTRFVAVGCGHLAGPESVLARLRQLDCRLIDR